MFDGDRELFLLTRALCRSTLSRFGERAPEQWRFVKNAHGKPSLVAEQAVGRRHFNLTNTPGLVACAVTSHGPLGLDAEPLDREVSSESVARRFFSPVEVADFLSLPEASRARRFLEYWTLKEAYIKARGGGLSIPLGGFSMTLKGLEAPSIEHHSEGSHARKTWVFWQQTLAGRYLVALALPASRPLRLKVSLHPADL